MKKYCGSKLLSDKFTEKVVMLGKIQNVISAFQNVEPALFEMIYYFLSHNQYYGI